jgi:hypothetical protein
MMTKIKVVLNIISAIAAILAAFLWFKSTLVKIPPSENPGEDGLIDASITSEGSDVIATGKRQKLWNRYAALAASAAALAQGISLLIPTD